MHRPTPFVRNGSECTFDSRLQGNTRETVVLGERRGIAADERIRNAKFDNARVTKMNKMTAVKVIAETCRVRLQHLCISLTTHTHGG